MIITLTYHYQLVWKGENGTIVIITPWKRAWSCIWTNFNPLHPDMVRAELCQICQVRLKLAKWFWRRFKILSMNFRIWTNLNQFQTRMLCAKFVWNWPSGSGGEAENVKRSQTDSYTDEQTTDYRQSEKPIELSAHVS